MSKGRYAPDRSRAPNTPPPGAAARPMPAFGIYRPVTSPWQENAQPALTEAQAKVWAFLARRPEQEPDRFTAYDAYGTTYLERGRICTMQRQHAPEFTIAAKLLGALTAGAADIEVPIDHFAWFGRKRTVLVGQFPEEGPAIDELRAERRVIQQALRQAGLKGVPIREPDHVSLFRYEHEPDQDGLEEWQRQRIVRIMDNATYQAGLTSVALGSIVLGNGYNAPINPDLYGTEWPGSLAEGAMEIPPFTPDLVAI